MMSSTIAMHATSREHPRQGGPDGTMRAAAEQLEGRVHGCEGLALGDLECRATPDQEAAEGDDERRDAAVGDQEALERPDGGPQGEREGDRR